MEIHGDQAAFIMAQKVFSKDQDPSRVIAGYDAWSKTYEESLSKGTYKAPFLAVEEVERLVQEEDRGGMRLLDVAAGTGWVGRELSKKGFKNMDALEPSEGMLNILKDTKIYNLTFQEFIGRGETSVPQGAYDAVIIAGGMGEGHVPLAGVDDMLRFAKPGGLVIIVMRLEFLETVEEYKGRLESHMERLEAEGRWRQETRRIIPDYFLGKEGVVFTYRVL